MSHLDQFHLGREIMYKIIFFVALACISLKNAVAQNEVKCEGNIQTFIQPDARQIDAMIAEIKAMPSYSEGYALTYDKSSFLPVTKKVEHYFLVNGVNHVKYVVETDCEKEILEIYTEFK